MGVIQYGFVACVALAVFWAWSALSAMLDFDAGPRVRRLRTRRGFRAIGAFEISVGLFLVSMSEWSLAPALLLFGVGFLFVARHPGLLP